MLTIDLLGRFRLRAGGVELLGSAWRSRKAASLVKLLALAPGYAMHRERLCDFLWPTFTSAAAANNLRQTLYQARTTLQALPLPPGSLLANAGDRVALYPADLVVTDVAAFETAAAWARRTSEPDAYWAAIDCYHGRLLPAVLYEDWVEARREALASLHAALLDDVAQLHQARGEYPRALDALQRLIAAEPIDEDAVAQLMRLAAATGHRSTALKHFRALEQTLARELDVTPESATRELYDEIRSGRFSPAVSFAPPSAGPAPVDAPRSNLPVALSSFIGREREVAEVAALAAAHRLVTLTGPGGTGKTRLALEAARAQTLDAVDEIWLVELASLGDPAALPQAIGRVLGIPTEGRGTAVDALAAGLRDRRVLLLLDNCEHLIEACAGLVAGLLCRCPNLHVLATGRSALRLPGERRWSVPALALPAPGAGLTDLTAIDAVRLFVDRVRWHQPDFMLTESNAGHVTAICRRLDGLPLALELAAAKSSVLTISQVAVRLSDALGLLSGGNRTAPSRQQTLRATLDWSYALLDGPEQTIFRRLAVFRGGWTLEAAEAVCAGGEIAARDLIGLLERLIDKSQVQVEHVDGAAWYRLLEPIQQYAGELLEASGEADDMRARHAAYFVAFVQEIEPALKGPEQSAWFARLDRDQGNLRAVFMRALARDDADTVLRLGGVLWRYWRLSWHSGEGLAWLEAALALPAATPSRIRARAMRGAGELARRLQRFDRARELLQASLDISRAVDDAMGVAWALVMLAGVLDDADDQTGARSRAQQALEMFRALGDQVGAALALNILAEDARLAGDYGRARDLYREALALNRASGEQLSSAWQLHNLGYVALVEGDVARAVRSFRESHLLSQAIGNRGGLLSFVEGMAASASAADRPIDATRLYAALTAACAPPGTEFKLHPPDQAEYDRYLARARAALGDAAFARAWKQGADLPEERAVAEALVLADALAGDQSPPAGTGPESLSGRERDIAHLVAERLTNHQIAGRLGLAERTVDTHVSHILRKLRVSTRGQIPGQLGAPESR